MGTLPLKQEVIRDLVRITNFYDSVGRDLEAAESWAAYKYVDDSGIPPTGSDEARHLDSLLGEAISFLEDRRHFFLAKEVRELRAAVDK